MRNKVNILIKSILIIVIFLTSIQIASSNQSVINKSFQPFDKLVKNIVIPQAGTDVLILKDGTEINCTIIEITDTEIKYKRADNPDGPIITINKSKVFKINYANGTSDFFGDANTNNTNVNNNPSNIYEGTETGTYTLALLSMIMGILSLFSFSLLFVSIALGLVTGIIFPILAYWFAYIVMMRTGKHPNWKGQWFAFIGFITSCLTYLFWLIIGAILGV